MLKVAVVGCAGRMGRTICEVINETEGTTLTGGTEIASSPLVGADLFAILNCGTDGPSISDNLEKIAKDFDVVIDFTIPKATMAHLEVVQKAGKAIIIGTTGFTHEQLTTIKQAGEKIKIVMAPNMSVGVNLMFKLVEEAAKVVGQTYDMEILDIHHNKKVDAPSGTAARLAEILADTVNRDLSKVGVYGRHGIVGQRTKEEIGIMTFRAGDVVGEHTVMFAGQGERLEITHKASSRANFARGAVRAAAWLQAQPTGLYDMQDVLGLR